MSKEVNELPVEGIYRWMPDMHGYLGLVICGDWVLTLGVMSTQPGIENWLKEVIDRRAWEDGSEPPDMFSQPH